MPLINSSFTSKVRNPGGVTLLDYLASRFDYHTREVWASLLAAGRMDLEGRPATGEEVPREGQGLLFRVVDYDEPEVPLDFAVLHRHDARGLAFVHKPAGMPVHRTGKIFFQTLANLVKESLGEGPWAPLNRLDRETSGIVAFARGAEAFRTLAPSSRHAAWAKLYVAAVRGDLPGDGIGRIDEPLGERPGDAIRTRMHVQPEGKRALTLYRVLARREGRTLVALSPITGRKHQLRAHLAHLGHPVVGDKIYADGGAAYLARLERELGPGDLAALGADRHLLHAFFLRIESGGTASEARDWEAGAAFDPDLPADALRSWMDSGAGRDFLAAAAAERRDLEIT